MARDRAGVAAVVATLLVAGIVLLLVFRPDIQLAQSDSSLFVDLKASVQGSVVTVTAIIGGGRALIWGDGNDDPASISSDGWSASHVYATTGKFWVTLSLRDSYFGVAGADSIAVVIG